MNTNPYETTHRMEPGESRLRSVRGVLAWSIFFAFASYPPLASAVQLLNAEFGFFPVDYVVYDVEINGVAVSNRSFALSSIRAGGLLLAIALVLALRARRNYRHNGMIRSALANRHDKALGSANQAGSDTV